jgi:hypothetical protein
MDGKRVKAKRKRRRFKQEAPLGARLLKMATEARHEASRLPLGSERSRLLRKAKQAEIGASFDLLLSLPREKLPQGSITPLSDLADPQHAQELERIGKWPQWKRV